MASPNNETISAAFGATWSVFGPREDKDNAAVSNHGCLLLADNTDKQPSQLSREPATAVPRPVDKGITRETVFAQFVNTSSGLIVYQACRINWDLCETQEAERECV